MASFNLFSHYSSTQTLLEKFAIQDYALTAVEKGGETSNPAADVFKGNSDEIETVIVGLPVPDSQDLYGAMKFSQSLIDKASGKISKDHIALSLECSNAPNYAIEAFWDTENNHPEGLTDEDIETDYLRGTHSAMECVSELLTQSNIPDDQTIDLYAINVTQVNELGFDEIAGRAKLTVGDLRTQGPKALANAIDQLYTDQVMYQLDLAQAKIDHRG